MVRLPLTLLLSTLLYAQSGRAPLEAADAAFKAGSAAYAKGDLASAHEQFAKLVELAPTVAAGHTAFGTVLLAEGDPAAAAAQLEQAHELDPHDNAAILSLALADSQLRRFSQAADLFSQLPASEPLAPDAVIAWASSLEATDRLPQALDRLQDALLHTPDSALLHDALGTLLAQQQKFDPAGAEFHRALLLDPTLAQAHFHLGVLLLAQQDPAAALPELERASQLNPTSSPYALALGQAQAALTQPDALATLRRALALDPSSTDAQYALALALQTSGDPAASLPLFSQVAAVRPQDPAVLTNYALSLVQTGDAKQAISLYQRALALAQPSSQSSAQSPARPSPTLYEDLGVAFLQQSDNDHAIQQFRAGLALDPSNPQLHYDLGLALKLQDKLADAIPEFQKAAALDPTLPDPPYTLGVLYMQQGSFPEAQAQLERATSLRPGNGAAWELLGNVYKQSDQPDKAIAALRRAIPLEPSQPSPHVTLAALLAQQGDRPAAAAERKIAADLSRVAVSRQRAEFALRSGQALLAQGKLPEAVVQLQAAVSADPTYPEPHAALAVALARQGRSAEAALERQQAEKLAAENRVVTSNPPSRAP